MRKLIDHPVLVLFFVYLLVVLMGIISLQVFFDVGSDFFLADDGYYQHGRKFFKGEISLSGNKISPGLIFLYSFLNLFPESLHSFLRLLLTLLVSFGNIFLAYKIFKKILPARSIFFGLMLAILNPLYIHWTIKSVPEIYVTFFLSVIILFTIQIAEKWNWSKILFLFVIFPVALFFKPVFFLIPIFLIICSLALKKRRLAIVFIFLTLFSLISFKAYIQFTTPEGKMSYGFSESIVGTYITQGMFKLKQFNAGTFIKTKNESPEKSVYLYTGKKIGNWMRKYVESHPNGGPLHMNIQFIKDNLGWVVISKLLSPLLFISLASTTFESIMNLLINSLILFFSFKAIKQIIPKERTKLSLFLFTLIGYFGIYFLTFSYARYAVPVIFLLTIFAGEKAERLYDLLKGILISSFKTV